MKRILDLLGISDGFRGGKNLNLSDFIDSASIEAAIESVIDGTYPRLRLVRGYKNKLKKAVYVSLTHISELVDQVPGPINASRETFVTDPGVKALFSSPAELQETFSCSDELRKFFAHGRHKNCDNCCALLCADKEEKNVLGSELNGDSIRREVLQTTINFHDHKVLSPAETEDEVRAGIKKCIFDGLVTYALQHILAIKTARQDLEDQRRILHSRLRARQSAGNGLSTMLANAQPDYGTPEPIAAKLLEAEKKLENMVDSKSVLTFYLNEITEILANPQDFIRLNIACFRITDMGIKVEGETQQPANTVCFSELEISNVMKRVVTVVRYPRNEMRCVNNNFV